MFKLGVKTSDGHQCRAPSLDAASVFELTLPNERYATELSSTLISVCLGLYTYFLVEGKTAATAPHLASFIAVRYFQVEPPIRKHSTELRV
jgi:hypothetical protein